ncbi:MAG TPA: hypothetical protein PKA37_07505, partial [Planctomycetota bacterium]|nr:hypothetical protein [Planctomycetota bacterium]
LLLHGPNGSAKSSLVEAMRGGLEAYSASDEGPLYRFSWIFCESTDKRALGFAGKDALVDIDSFAHVDERLMTSRIPDETRDNPLLLLPAAERRRLLQAAVAEAAPEERDRFRFHEGILRGDLSPKNRVIYDCLLKAYEGDWRRVIRHVRIERYEIAHRYRLGSATIEPQGTIDGAARMVGHGSMSGLPPILFNETLMEVFGDIVDANHGILEYSDFLKRNMEANKYLLGTAERGEVNLQGVQLHLNLLLIGTTNEKFLASFKRDPTFASFRGRFEFVRVPYLLEYKKEAQIYQSHLGSVATGRHVAPHTATVAALWAVLTRLRPARPEHYSGEVGKIVARLSPLEKARLYDRGEIPSDLNEEQRKALRGAVKDIAREYDGQEEENEGYVDAAYEGRRGASPREMMSLLTEIAVERVGRTLTPVDVFEALPRLTKDPTLYSWLRLKGERGFFDPVQMVDMVRREYLKHIATEVQKASDLVDEGEYQRLFLAYIHHVRAHETQEKVVNQSTGRSDAPDQALMANVEDRIGVQSGRAGFRQDIMNKIGAFRLTHPDRPLVLTDLFRDHVQALEKSFFKERRDKIVVMVEDALLLDAGGGQQLLKDRRDAASKLVARLIADFGYNDESVQQVLAYFKAHHHELLD